MSDPSFRWKHFGRLRASLDGHTDPVVALALSPDGSLVATGSWDKTVKVWNAATGGEVATHWGHGHWITSVVFLPDNKTLATGGLSKAVQLWDAESGELKATLGGHAGAVLALAVSPDGRLLASAGEDRVVGIWRMENGEWRMEKLEGHADKVACIAFSPDGALLASGSWDTTVRLWKLETGNREPETLRGHSQRITALAFSPDGALLASGSWDNTIALWEIRNPQSAIRNRFEGHTEPVTCLAFSPDGRDLLSGSWDKTIRVWDVAGRREIHSFMPHSGWVLAMAFSRDGRTFATASVAKQAKLWEVPEAVRSAGCGVRDDVEASSTGNAHTGEITAVSFAPGGGQFITASVDRSIRLWSPGPPPALLRTLGEHQDEALSAAYTLDRTRIISTDASGTAIVWEAEPGRPCATLPGQAEPELPHAFSPAAGRLARSGLGGEIELWGTDGRLYASIPRPPDTVVGLLFSPDGGYLAARTRKTIRLWTLGPRDAAPGPDTTVFEGSYACMAFSPDGRTLAAGFSTDAIHLWKLELPGPEPEAIKGYPAEVTALAFSPDGRILVAGCRDGSLHVR